MEEFTPQEVTGLERLLTLTADGVFAVDSQRRFVLFNAACEKLTGYSAEEVVGAACQCMTVTDCHDERDRSLAGALCPGLPVFNGQVPNIRHRMRITTKANGHRWVEAQYAPVSGAEGRPEFVIGVMRDVSEEKEREDRWQAATEHLSRDVEQLRRDLREQYGFTGLLSRSPLMSMVFEKVRAACTNSSPVLIGGEPGAGKETIARTIRLHGLQSSGPFVALNCCGTEQEAAERELFGYLRGSFAGAGQDYPGLIRVADGGTLFLEDIQSLPERTQARLQRAIQDRSVRPVGSVEEVPVNVRVIAAVNQPLAGLVSSGKLREDLHSRLSVMTIEPPPLRARKEDIPLLVEDFLSQIIAQGTRQIARIGPGCWPVLEAHDWPGNLRELRHVMESALAATRGDTLEPDALRRAIRSRGGEKCDEHDAGPIRLDEVLANVERRTILSGLRRARDQRSLAAKLMGISRSRLYRRMDALGISSRQEER